MSYPLTAAAVILIGIGIAHSYLGEKFVIVRLFRRSDLPTLFGSDAFTRRILRFAWHLTTIAWWGFAVILLVLADHFGSAPGSSAPLTSSPASTPQTIGNVIGITLGLTGVAILGASRGKHLAWPLFVVAAVLTWVGV